MERLPHSVSENVTVMEPGKANLFQDTLAHLIMRLLIKHLSVPKGVAVEQIDGQTLHDLISNRYIRLSHHHGDVVMHRIVFERKWHGHFC